MGFVVGGLNRTFVGSVDEAEGGRSLFVEPVGEELDPVLALGLQVLLVGIGYGMM